MIARASSTDPRIISTWVGEDHGLFVKALSLGDQVGDDGCVGAKALGQGGKLAIEVGKRLVERNLRVVGDADQGESRQGVVDDVGGFDQPRHGGADRLDAGRKLLADDHDCLSSLRPRRSRS